MKTLSLTALPIAPNSRGNMPLPGRNVNPAKMPHVCAEGSGRDMTALAGDTLMHGLCTLVHGAVRAVRSNFLTPFFAPRAILANSGLLERGLELGLGVNVSPIDPADQWVMISPYGEFRHGLGVQKVNRASADKMVAAFNSLRGRLGRMFRGVFIYVGHPDVDPGRWPDEKRLGSIEELEARADGLWGRARWNAAGEDNLQNGYWVYPSPAWYFRKNSSGVIEPDELKSVGLTNSPNISESVPWTNSNNNPAAGQRGNQPNNTMDRNRLIALLGLTPSADGVEITNEEIETALNSALQRAATAANAESALTTARSEATTAQTALNTARARVSELEGTLRTAIANHAAELLDAAVNDGRITAADRPTHEAAFNSDFAAARTALAARTPVLNTREISIGDRRASIATAAERTAIIANAVQHYQSEHAQASYEEAYGAVQRDPRFAAVFDAMQKPEGAK